MGIQFKKLSFYNFKWTESKIW